MITVTVSVMALIINEFTLIFGKLETNDECLDGRSLRKTLGL